MQPNGKENQNAHYKENINYKENAGCNKSSTGGWGQGNPYLVRIEKFVQNIG